MRQGRRPGRRAVGSQVWKRIPYQAAVRQSWQGPLMRALRFFCHFGLGSSPRRRRRCRSLPPGLRSGSRRAWQRRRRPDPAGISDGLRQRPGRLRAGLGLLPAGSDSASPPSRPMPSRQRGPFPLPIAPTERLAVPASRQEGSSFADPIRRDVQPSPASAEGVFLLCRACSNIPCHSLMQCFGIRGMWRPQPRSRRRPLQISLTARGMCLEPSPRAPFWNSFRHSFSIPSPSAKVHLLLEGALHPSPPSLPIVSATRHAVPVGDAVEASPCAGMRFRQAGLSGSRPLESRQTPRSRSRSPAEAPAGRRRRIPRY